MRRFLLDSFFCVIFIFGIIGLFASVTFLRIFDVFDPIGEMFADFDLSDLVMSQLRDSPPASEDIVMVNIGYLDRDAIAAQIEIIKQYNPRAIGLDAYLPDDKTFSEDSFLMEVVKTTPNLIIADKLSDYDEETDSFRNSIRPHSRISDYAQFGYANLLTDAANQDDLKSCREFSVWENYDGERQYALGVRLAMLKDPVKTKKFLDRRNRIESINFKGNVISFNFTDFGTRYYVLDVMDVLSENFTQDLLTDKVVIMCFMGKALGDEQTRTDRYFTPLNKRYVGKAEPDMWGGVVHANIVSMILEDDVINTMSRQTGIVLAIVVCMINVLLFKFFYGALPRWYDGITKLIQLLQLLFLFSAMIFLFAWFNYKANFTLAMIVITLSGDSIEVYHGVIRNLFSPTERSKLFRINWNFLREGRP